MIGKLRNIKRTYEDVLFGDVDTEDKRVYRIMIQRYDRGTKLWSHLKDGDYVLFNSHSNMMVSNIEYIPEKDGHKVKYDKIDDFRILNSDVGKDFVILKSFDIIIEATYDQKNYGEKSSFCYQKVADQLEKKVKKLGGNAIINGKWEENFVWKGFGNKTMVTVFKITGTVAIIGKPNFNGSYTKDELIGEYWKEKLPSVPLMDKIKAMFKKK